MILYPAIDIKDGKCVRLCQGKFDDVTIFGDDPLVMAKKWEACGCEYIHLVDLDGARGGVSKNRDIIIKIAKSVNVPVQIGGGIRTIETAYDYIKNGVSRVILGTSAVKDEVFTKHAVEKFGDKIAVGIDAKDGFAAVEGWEEVSNITALFLAEKMMKIGVKTLIYTDIATDGMLQGPNVSAMREMASAVSCDIIASGGVSSLDDLMELNKTGVQGVIVGKALYTERVDLKKALEALRSAL